MCSLQLALLLHRPEHVDSLRCCCTARALQQIDGTLSMDDVFASIEKAIDNAKVVAA